MSHPLRSTTEARTDEPEPGTEATREAPRLGNDADPADEHLGAGLKSEPAEYKPVPPRRLRPRRSHRGWLVGLFAVAMVLSLVAGSMAIAVRGAQDVAHYLGTIRAWGADAYSCAVVGGIAILAWAAFFGAAVRSIRESKLAPPAWNHPVGAPLPAPAEAETAVVPRETDQAVAAGSGR